MSDLPLRVILAKIGDVSKSQAENFCRGKVERYFDESNRVESFFFTKKVNKEWYCEIHEGGKGRAFLPNTLKTLEDENEPNEVIIPSGTRYVKADIDNEGVITFRTLGEDDKPESLSIKSTSAMTPYQGDSRNYLIVSVSVLIASFSILVASYIASKSVDTFEFSSGNDQFTTLHRVMNQMERLPEGRFIEKIEFKGGMWRSDIGKREVIDETKEELSLENEIADNALYFVNNTQGGEE